MFGINKKDRIDLEQQAYEAEFAGDIKKAIALWRKVLNQRPNNIDAITNLAGLLQESNNLKEAIEVVQPLADSQHQNLKVQKLFIDLLIEAKEFEWAKRHADILDNKNPNNNFRKYVDAAENIDDDTDIKNETVGNDDWISSFAGEPLFTKEHAVRLNMLFLGRQDVFARMWVSEAGNTGYSPVYKPYTPQIAYNHLLGNFTTGIYVTKTNGDTKILAFDIDITAEAINHARGSAEKAKELRKKLFDFATKFYNFLKEENLNPVLEDSGYKGAHIWIIFNRWLKCGVLKRLGDSLLVANGNVPFEISVEVFPKQKNKPKKLGNLIKLPLGIHRKTGKRSLLLDNSAKPFDNQPEALMKIKPANASIINSLLDKFNIPEDLNPVNNKQKNSTTSTVIKNAKTKNSKKNIISEKDFNEDGPLNYLLKRCEVLNKLVNRIKITHIISYDEKVVLEHTIGHLPNGPSLVNFLLRSCQNVDSNFFMGKPHKGCPTSCNKINARLPHITMTCSCCCDFDVACANYPTPLNHLYSYKPETGNKAKIVKALPLPQKSKVENKNNENSSIDIINLLSKLYRK